MRRTTGGDKERSKEEKHSKLGKLRQQFSKGAYPETVQTKAVFKSDNSNSETPTFLKESSNSNARRHDPVKGNDCDKKEDNRPFKSEEVYSADDAKSANSNESDFRDQNLTCYLENAIMESANSTLDRSARLNQQFNNSSDKIFPKDNDKVGRVDTENLQNGKDVSSSEPPCDTAKGLFVEYVNYDLLNAAEGSNGSSEYYSSDNEDNPKANSNNNNSYNRQGIIGTDQGPRLSVKENSKVAGPMLRCRNQAENSPKLSQTEEEPRSGNSFSRNDQRNNHLARKSSEEESRPTNAAKRTAADGKSQNATRPCSDETVKYSIDHHSVFAAALSVVGEGYVEDNSEIIPGNEDYKRTVQELGTKGLRVNTQHDVQCPLRTGIKDLNPDITDMEKARSIFGRSSSLLSLYYLYHSCKIVSFSSIRIEGMVW